MATLCNLSKLIDFINNLPNLSLEDNTACYLAYSIHLNQIMSRNHAILESVICMCQGAIFNPLKHFINHGDVRTFLCSSNTMVCNIKLLITLRSQETLEVIGKIGMNIFF